MSNRILLFLMFSCMSMITIVGQHVTIPDHPKEIRLLPENFKENYQSEEYNYTEGISLITKFKIWLVQKLRDLFDIDDQSAKQSFEGIKYVIYFTVIGIAVYLLIKMVLGKEGSWLFKRNKKTYEDPDYAIEQDIQSINFEKLIQKAVSENDYRLAVKYHYFYLLRKLDAANIITYDPQKTTYDYQLDLEVTKYNSVFSKAAYYYTYIWYGEFSIDAKEYHTTSVTFTQLLATIKDE